MRKAQPEQKVRKTEPASHQPENRSRVSAGVKNGQFEIYPSRSAENLSTAINASSPLAAQRKVIGSIDQGSLSLAKPQSAYFSASRTRLAGSEKSNVQLSTTLQSPQVNELSIQKKPAVEQKAEGLDKQKLEEDRESGSAADKVTKNQKGESGDDVSPWMREVGFRLLGMSGPNDPQGKDGGKKPAEEAQEEVKKEEEVEIPPKEADTVSPDLLSFLKIPSKYPKLKQADNDFGKFQQAFEEDSEKSNAKSKKPKSDDSEKKADEPNDEESAEVSEYTGGIVNLVKSGYKSCMKLKDAYDEYQKIKEDSKDDASVLDDAKTTFELALTSTSGVLTGINEYQKNFGTAQSLALKMAVPAIGIALSTISLIGRIVTLVQQGNFDFGKTATESQTDSILSSVVGDDKKKAEIKQILESEKFRSLIAATAEYRQQQRDNPDIFNEYKKSLGDADLQERLKKRYPENFARIEEIHKNNQLGPDQIGAETKQLVGLGVGQDMLEAIIGDQTLINHLEEVKDKRSTNAKIGIFTDLVNIGADIATLTGTGAVVGAAMKAGTAAIDISRKGGNAIKFAARAKGAENFSSGAEGGWFGSSLLDVTDILKNDDAKQERYFHSSRLLVESIADHDMKVVGAGKKATKDQVSAINTSYGWVETKILGTGSSVTMIKALANSDKKTGNDIVKYFMEKMKAR